MRPGTIAAKLLRRTSGGGGFVADFPSSKAALEKSVSEPIFPIALSGDQQGALKYKIFVGTWNVGGAVPEDGADMEDWLDAENTYDIYVLGFQETVPLSTRNVLGPERRRASSRWNSLIGAALNRSSAGPKEQGKVGEKQKVHPVKDPRVGGGEGGARDFWCVMSEQMVGILVSVWTRSDLRHHILYPAVSSLGCGVMGVLGNKGAVSVRFRLQGTSFCFVCCHLASGGKDGDVLRRNSDAMEILSRTSFPRACSSLDLPRKIMDHDRVILFGDLNYRISLPDDRTRSLVETKDWNTLLENDQLRAEASKGGVFDGWREGDISFSPTYKYYPNSDEYYGCVPGRKGERRRVPAWCDRILWFGKGLSQTRYERCESRLSDHRPVRAVFTAEAEEYPGHLTSLESFFLVREISPAGLFPVPGSPISPSSDHAHRARQI